MIEVQHLTKLYGPHVAIEDISFSVEPGRIYGLLGPNGAGKSTTMNIMTGCLNATAGEVSIGGHSITGAPQKAKKLIGYLPEHPPLYTEMTPQEYLHFVARAKEVPAKEIPGQIDYVMDVTQIAPMRNRLIRQLSKGYQQRVGIAQALLGKPQVIILDEPMVGLDPKQIIEIRDMIHALGKDHTVILSSHILSEIQAICDHILIISGGKLVASDTLENLERRFSAAPTVTLLIKANKKSAEAAVSAVEGAAVESAQSIGDGTVRLEVAASGKEDIREKLFFALSEAKLPILEMSSARTNLEDVFLEVTKTEQPPKKAKKEGVR